LDSPPHVGPPIYARTFIDTLAGVFGAPRWSGNTLHWISTAGTLKARVQTFDADTVDGRRLAGVITLLQELRLPSHEAAETLAARHNQEPGLGVAFVVEGSPGTVELISRMSFYGNTLDFHEKLGVTLAIAALANLTTSLEHGAGHRLPPLPQRDQPSRWGIVELTRLVRQMRRHGERPWTNGSSLVAKLNAPDGWLSGASDNGEPTLIVSAECRHSSLGNGLAVEASVRVDASQAQASSLVRNLNRVEADSITGPPLLGAWGLARSDQRLVFRSFWPNLAHIPGLVDYIATWHVERLEYAREALTQMLRLWLI